jgi:hypothetical protein
MTRFISHFDTARDYTSQFTITHALVSTVPSTLPLLVSGFQTEDISFPLGSQTVQGLDYQLVQLTTGRNFKNLDVTDYNTTYIQL